jgi:hypothetical protein
MPKRSFAILLVSLLAARACLVLSLSDVFFFGEEMAKGTAAKAMIDGLGVQHYMLNYGYHEGGGFVVSHLKLVAFLLVGENLVAQKLVALFTAGALLAVGCWFTSEHFGRRAGWIFGALYVLGPAAFQRLSLVGVGTHYESAIFIVLILHFAFRIAFAKEYRDVGSSARADRASGSSSSSLRRRILEHVGLGLSAGFGLYFSLQCVPAIACAALTLIAFERKRALSRATLFALGAFALGGWPLWYTMSKIGTAALIVRAQEIGKGTTLAEGIRVLFEPIALHGNAFDWIVLALYPIAVGLGLAVMWRAARARTASASVDLAPALRKALILSGYGVLFLVLYLGSGLAVGNEGHWFMLLRLSPLWIVSILLIAAASCALSAGNFAIARRVHACIVAVLLAAGAIAFVRVVDEGRPSELGANAKLLASTKGYIYSEYLDKFVHHFEAPDEEKIAILLHFRDEPELLWPSINHSLFEKSALSLDDVLAISRRAYGDRWLESLKGLGPYLRASNGYDLTAELAAIARAPDETHLALAEAAGRTGLGLKIYPDRIEKEIRSSIPSDLRAAFLRGTGWRIHQINRLWPERAREFIARESPEDRAPLREGFEAALAANTIER